ncbi:VOC family protein [Aestuariibius sp. HNIBRBA575]|uniref:VOC family protein n=1 Tax=Aestuariibius sp. HNIBRBA575 TaxID=3233343 RepID=UPI0034A2BAB1
MRFLKHTIGALCLTSGFAMAEPFQEVTIGVPVASIVEAEAWYLQLLGSDVEVLRPYPGVVEFKAAPGMWLQIFETDDQQTSGTVIRFLVEDIAETQTQHADVGLQSGEAIEVPNVVTFSEFSDPDGNALGLYDLP